MIHCCCKDTCYSMVKKHFESGKMIIPGSKGIVTGPSEQDSADGMVAVEFENGVVIHILASEISRVEKRMAPDGSVSFRQLASISHSKQNLCDSS